MILSMSKRTCENPKHFSRTSEVELEGTGLVGRQTRQPLGKHMAGIAKIRKLGQSGSFESPPRVVKPTHSGNLVRGLVIAIHVCRYCPRDKCSATIDGCNASVTRDVAEPAWQAVSTKMFSSPPDLYSKACQFGRQ